MPELPLLEPYVLSGVVQKMQAPETMVLLNQVDKEQTTDATIRWDITYGTRMVAKPNVPNAEAHIVPMTGFSQNTAHLVYLREKKVFQATTLKLLRAPGTNVRERAEAAVAREMADLNTRLDNFAELALWAALKGRLIMEYEDVVTDVDYKMPASHKPTPAVSWDAATPGQIMADIDAWKSLIDKDARVPARDVYTTKDVMALIYNAFASGSASLMSDRMRDQYYLNGTLPGFLGLNITQINSTYEETAGVFTNFIPKHAVFLGNYTDGNPITLMEGPSMDDDAPQDFVGKFSKTWKMPDPSGRQALIEWAILPIVYRPEQFVYVDSVVF